MNSYFCLVLHSHMPFIRHPEHNAFLQEDWLFEAITETYLPLLDIFFRMQNENIPFKLTINISPTLSAMLNDKLLMNRYEASLNKLIDLMHKEQLETSIRKKEFVIVANFYLNRLTQLKKIFKKYKCNILNGFKYFMNSGNLEIITSPATHPVLPLVLTNNAKRAQVRAGIRAHINHFSSPPSGMWLPECAYENGIGKILKDEGIKYSFIEAHGIMFGKPFPLHGIWQPVLSPENIVLFGRDIEISKQVWSSKEGYPGDFNYREFYRDLGYDANYEYVRPYLHKDGIRRNIGIKYYKITGNVKLANKKIYDPNKAYEKVIEHSKHFINKLITHSNELSKKINTPPVITTPFDTELFGHWWFEGPEFIYNIFKEGQSAENLIFTSPSHLLENNINLQHSQPISSTWGDKGYLEMWVNQSNDWIYMHLHHCENELLNLIKLYNASEKYSQIKARILTQASKELMLAQSSDWAFMMSTKQDIPYSCNRVRTHISNFLKLVNIFHNPITENVDFLSSLEEKTSPLNFIRYEDYEK